jgi:hypothetical protein
LEFFVGEFMGKEEDEGREGWIEVALKRCGNSATRGYPLLFHWIPGSARGSYWLTVDCRDGDLLQSIKFAWDVQ